MEGQRLRLFVAVEVPEPVRAAVDAVLAALRPRAPQANWTAAAGWHLTLAFLGGVEAERVEAVEDALAQAAGEVEPFTLRLDGTVGTFGGRVLWAGLEGSAPLAALAGHVRDALAPLGFPPEERPFHAHLTLARARRGGRLPRDLAADYAGPRPAWRVERLALMRSRLGRGGARYEVHASWPLGREG